MGKAKENDKLDYPLRTRVNKTTYDCIEKSLERAIAKPLVSLPVN